jgi:hypothetical protein
MRRICSCLMRSCVATSASSATSLCFCKPSWMAIFSFMCSSPSSSSFLASLAACKREGSKHSS